MARGPDMQRSRAGQTVDDELLAKYTAAKGFLFSAMIGALLMAYSFTHLYLFGLRTGANIPLAYAVAITCLALGSLIWWRSRAVYLALDFPWRRGWEIASSLIAAAAGAFWLLFILATILVWRGVDLLGA